jgi:hypothetical protein
MADRHDINEKFYWAQAPQANLIRVFDMSGDLLVEYSKSSGALRWQRQTSAEDKSVIDRFLLEEFGARTSK